MLQRIVPLNNWLPNRMRPRRFMDITGSKQWAGSLNMICMDWTYFALLGEIILAVVGICIFTLAAVMIHEMGHAGTALLFGFRVMAVRVGPIVFKKQESTQWAVSPGTWGSGLVQAQFRKLPGPWATPRYAAFLLGGAVANLGAAVLFAGFSIDENLFGMLSGCLMLACIIVGLSSLIPVKTKLGASDGRKLLMILFSRRRRQDSVFRLSLLARIVEIRTLARDRHFQMAIDRIDELVSRYAKLPDANPDATLHLSKLGDELKKSLAESGTSNATDQVAEG